MKFIFPKELLPEDAHDRYQFLHGYFCDQRAKSWLSDNTWVVELYWPDTLEHFVDPRMHEGLLWWSPEYKPDNAHQAVKRLGNFQLSLNDSWTLYSWSQWLCKNASAQELIILHVDYHSDLMSPRIGAHGGSFIDLLTKGEVDLLRPESIKQAILSGAIGIGSFMVPFLHQIEKVHLRHLCEGPLTKRREGVNFLRRDWEVDTLIDPAYQRPKVHFDHINPLDTEQKGIHFKITDDLEAWVADLPRVPILLHIDMDYFNCRFDGDSDWQTNERRFDPDFAFIEGRINQVFDLLEKQDIKPLIADIAVALSPGFFPVEFWDRSIHLISERVHMIKG